MVYCDVQIRHKYNYMHKWPSASNYRVKNAFACGKKETSVTFARIPHQTYDHDIHSKSIKKKKRKTKVICLLLFENMAARHHNIQILFLSLAFDMYPQQRPYGRVHRLTVNETRRFPIFVALLRSVSLLNTSESILMMFIGKVYLKNNCPIS